MTPLSDPPTLASTLHHIQVFPPLYRTGTIIAASGTLAIAIYYNLAWRSLKHPLSTPDPANLEPCPCIAFQYFYWGAGASVLCFLLAGSADTPPTFLDHLVGLLIALCGVLIAAMFGVGFIALYNLWCEAMQQILVQFQSWRHARVHSGKPKMQLLAVPLAILFFAFGISVFIVMGMILAKIPKVLEPLLYDAVWSVIAALFIALWTGRGNAALLLRAILLMLFTLIMLASVIFLIVWTASQTSPLLVILLLAIGSINASFYARWIRSIALADNFM